MKKINTRERYLIILVIALSIFMIGSTFNYLAIQDNNGDMPVKLDYNYTDNHHFSFQNNSEVNLWYFTDIINVFGNYWSIGDIIMGFGVITALICYGLIIKYNYRKR